MIVLEKIPSALPSNTTRPWADRRGPCATRAQSSTDIVVNGTLTGLSWLPDDPAIRRVAIAILLVSLGSALWAGWPIAFVTWCGLLPLFAGAILRSLTYAPWLARAGAVIAGLAVVAGALR